MAYFLARAIKTVQPNELAYEKLNEVKKGIGSADQVFGTLEREFSAYNRQRLCYQSLKTVSKSRFILLSSIIGFGNHLGRKSKVSYN